MGQIRPSTFPDQNKTSQKGDFRRRPAKSSRPSDLSRVKPGALERQQSQGRPFLVQTSDSFPAQVAHISGNQGSWTNSDDVVIGGPKAARRRARRAAAKALGVIRDSATPGAIQTIREALKPIVKSALVNTGSVLGSAAGTALGGPALSAIGARFGRAAARRFSRLIGSGDYMCNEVVTNSLIRGYASPDSSFGTEDTVMIKNREYICDIATNSTPSFSNNVFSVNPGLAATFPWLSQVAANYECYMFHGLVFELVSTTSPYSTSNAMGSVVATFEFNATTQSFTSKTQMENSNDAISARLDKSVLYGVECAKGTMPQSCYYVRSSTSSQPVAETDMGVFQVATAPASTFAASSVTHELWVTYSIELAKPRLSQFDPGYFHSSRTFGAASTPLGTTNVQLVATGSMTGASITSTVLTLTNARYAENYLIVVLWAGTSVSNPTSPSTTPSGLTALSVFADYTSGQFYNNVTGGGSSNTLTYAGIFTCTTNPPVSPTLTFGTGGTIPTTASVDVFVWPLGRGWTASTL